MYSEGDQAVALDLLKSIGKTYPKTDVARQARAEAAKIEQTITDEKARKLDKEASQLAVQADRQIEDEISIPFTAYGNVHQRPPEGAAQQRRMHDRALFWPADHRRIWTDQDGE